MKRKNQFSRHVYLHNIWALKVVRWEYLQFELVWNVIGTSLRLVLIIDQVGNHIGLPDVDQETISDNYGSLQLRKGTISFSKVTDFVLSVQQIKLNVKLSALMIVAASHHGIDGARLLFAGI